MLMLVCFAAVVITQTRAVWLGLLVALAAVALVALVVLVRKQQRRLSGQRVVLLLLLPLLAGLVLAKPIVEKRLGVEREGIVQVLRGNTQQLALDSVGVRVVMWQFAATKIAERPWLGWGADTRLYLFADDAWPSKIQHRFGRFHNSYLEVLVAYGVGGLLALAWLVWCSTLGMLRLLRSHAASTGAGVLAGWLLFAMANHFESYVVMATGRFFVVLLGGVGLSFYYFPLSRKGG